MRFLLTAVNAKYIHSNPAVYSLQAYACQEDPTLKEQIFVAEYTINQQMEDVLADLYEHRPDVIGFSCYIWNIPYIEKLVRELKKLLPQVQIWLGGPEVSFDAEKVMEEYPQLTGIMLGEGEQTFLELAQHYRSGESGEEALSRIAGLAIRKNGKVILTGPRVLTDLSVIPFLYDDLKKFENKILYYESSRGCPFRCSYCLSSIDKKVRLRDLSIVKRELQFFLDQKVAQVKFVDRTFNCNKKHAMEIWEYLLAHDNGITNFHFEIAADILDEEQIRLLNQFTLFSKQGRFERGAMGLLLDPCGCLPIITQFGGEVFDRNANCAFDSDAFFRGLCFFEKIIRHLGCCVHKWGDKREYLGELLADGRFAFILGSEQDAAFARERLPKDAFYELPLPGYAAGQKTAFSALGIGLSAGRYDPAELLRFLAEFYTKENLLSFAKKLRSLPVLDRTGLTEMCRKARAQSQPVVQCGTRNSAEVCRILFHRLFCWIPVSRKELRELSVQLSERMRRPTSLESGGWAHSSTGSRSTQ